jgi:hypothetical protein
MRFDRWENSDASESVTFDQLVGGTGLVPIVPTSVVVAGVGSSASASNLGKVTFAVATSVSLNDVFSADYQKYRLVWRCNSSENTTFRMRFRVAGSDVTTSSYVRGLLSVRNSGATFTFSDTGATNFGITNVNSPAQGRASGVLDFDSPFISSQTTISGHSVGHDPTSVFFTISGFQHITAASYTGLTFFPSAGTFLGEVQVFGYNE